MRLGGPGQLLQEGRIKTGFGEQEENFQVKNRENGQLAIEDSRG